MRELDQCQKQFAYIQQTNQHYETRIFTLAKEVKRLKQEAILSNVNLSYQQLQAMLKLKPGKAFRTLYERCHDLEIKINELVAKTWKEQMQEL